MERGRGGGCGGGEGVEVFADGVGLAEGGIEEDFGLTVSGLAFTVTGGASWRTIVSKLHPLQPFLPYVDNLILTMVAKHQRGRMIAGCATDFGR